MTLVKTDGDGYVIFSNIGKRYGLYELTTLGTPTPRTKDCVAIMYEDPDPALEEIIYFFYGTNMDTLNYDVIRRKIEEFENERFKDDCISHDKIVFTF